MRINKTRATFMLATLILTLSSFGGRNKDYQTECVSIETDAYITIKIWNAKKGAKYKLKNARKDAIHAILFSGVSGENGCTTQPPMINTTEGEGNFKAIENQFFSKRGKWTTFTRSAVVATAMPKTIGTENWKVYQVSISKKELRKFLEDNKIIKPLTTGF